MPVSVPKRVKIGGINIAIRIDPMLEAWGEYRADDREIVLAGRTLEKRSSLRETLRHEIMHASLDICGLSYLSAYSEESIVRCLDNVFFPAWDGIRKKII